MIQTLSPAAISSPGQAPRNCPAWCEIDHADGNSHHLGALFDMDLSRAEPGYLPTTDGSDAVSDFLAVNLWQEDDNGNPVVNGLTSGLFDRELPELTLDEAEELAHALLDLVSRGRGA